MKNLLRSKSLCMRAYVGPLVNVFSIFFFLSKVWVYIHQNDGRESLITNNVELSRVNAFLVHGGRHCGGLEV